MAVAEKYGDQVRFVGVPGQAETDSMQDFVRSTGTDVIEHIPDLSGDLWLRFDVRQQRTYVYINDDGSWRRSEYGSLEQDVQDLIAQ